jgi:hypothetical protein
MMSYLFAAIFVCFIWLVWEAKNAPLMDDDGNIIDDEENI